MINIEFEKKLCGQRYNRILSTDEVGLGSVAMDLLACAIIVDCDHLEQLRNVHIVSSKRKRKVYITDSKLLNTELEIPLMYKAIMSSRTIRQISFGWVSVKEINDLNNMRQAQILAFNRAIEPLLDKCDVVITGNVKPSIDLGNKPVYPLIKAELKCVSVAASSIIAKNTRDEYCREMAKQYTNYMWDKNKGYSTRQHFDALVKYGLTPLHRVHYKDCKMALDIRNKT